VKLTCDTGKINYVEILHRKEAGNVHSHSKQHIRTGERGKQGSLSSETGPLIKNEKLFPRLALFVLKVSKIKGIHFKRSLSI